MAIWRAWWMIAVASLLPLAIATHVTTCSPADKPVEPVGAPVGKPFVERVSIPQQPIAPRWDGVICPVVGPCWKDGKPISGAL